MGKENPETCCYCVNHIWSDHQRFHVCIKDDTEPREDGGMDREEAPCDQPCQRDPKQFRDAKRFQNTR